MTALGKYLNQLSLTRILVSLFVLFLVGACTRQPVIPSHPAAPMPENVSFEDETQKQIQSSRQWQIVAEDMAEQLAQTIQQNNWTKSTLHVFPQSKPTTFTRAFNDFLITSLVNKGVKVTTVKTASRVFNYKIQLVEYNSFRSTMLSENYKFSSLAAGVVVARNIGEVLGVDGTLLAGGVALDAADLNFAPNLEVIITSSIVENNVFVLRTTDIYYANRADKHLYIPANSQRNTDVFSEPFYQLK